MAVALNKVDAFAGFSPQDVIQKKIMKYKTSAKHFGHFATQNPLQIKVLMKTMMECDPKIVEDMISEINSQEYQTREEKLAVRNYMEFGNDQGVLVSHLLLNCLELQPGQAFVMHPHEPHSYASGDIVEIMALSDAVIRFGLTKKFMDMETIMEITDWSMKEKQCVTPVKKKEGQFRSSTYSDPAYWEFQVVWL